MYSGNKNIKNTFLIKQYFATYVAFATYVYIYICIYIYIYVCMYIYIYIYI